MPLATISLRTPLLRRVGRATGEMLSSAPGLSFDFSAPPGEPALLPADSISWRIFKNPVTLFIGGVTAVLLELAEPLIVRLGLQRWRLRKGERALVRAAAKLADRVILTHVPAAQASRRLGLPADWVYRK